MNTMLAGLLYMNVFLLIQVQGSSISKRYIPPKVGGSKRTDPSENCILQAGSNECQKNYMCGSGDPKSPLTVKLYCPTALQQKCAVPLVRGKCGFDVCPCRDHNGKSYNKGESYTYGDEKGPGPLYECTCNKDNRLCGAVCGEPIEIVPIHKPKAPPTFPPFPFAFPFPGGGRR